MSSKQKQLKNCIAARLRKMDRSQGWLSRETLIGRAHINKIVNGRFNPQLHTAKLIADTLHCLIDDLWEL